MLVIVAYSSHCGKVMILLQSLTMVAQKLRGTFSFDSEHAWPVVQKFCYYLKFQLYTIKFREYVITFINFWAVLCHLWVNLSCCLQNITSAVHLDFGDKEFPN